MLKPALPIQTDLHKPDGEYHPTESCLGFTMIEMILVVFLLGLTLSLAIPRIHQSVFADGADDAIRWFTSTAGALKVKAIKDQLDYTLHIDIDNGIYWFSNEAMTEEARQAAMENSYRAPDDILRIQIVMIANARTILRYGNKTPLQMV